ncbi:MAG: hypothetical protein BZ151_06205 [Desulfobacca sp. 4484_104]|nr:MAG: hypothetical protein BZ151_06205 [Desulfobacca sp. 4484_104]
MDIETISTTLCKLGEINAIAELLIMISEGQEDSIPKEVLSNTCCLIQRLAKEVMVIVDQKPRGN